MIRSICITLLLASTYSAAQAGTATGPSFTLRLTVGSGGKATWISTTNTTSAPTTGAQTPLTDARRQELLRTTPPPSVQISYQ